MCFYDDDNLPDALPEHLAEKVLEIDEDNTFAVNCGTYFKRYWKTLDKELKRLKENNFKIFKQTEDVILLRGLHTYEDMDLPEEENAIVFPKYKVTFFEDYELMCEADRYLDSYMPW